ncbi:MAG: hypothetical protein K2V38_02595 [Gemmataceae bacterium]|nr:hypothetical protein [Gemmataceae bacterium]
MSPNRLTADQLRDLAGVLLKTRPHELTCDEWLDHVAGYADAILAGRLPPDGAEMVAHHLDLCPECREEYDALLAALRAGPG